MVSVIIPNYNHAQYLTGRIESVLNQTYADFEVIVLDDNSSDNSREIIERYRNHPKVKHIVYNEENSGSTFKQWDKGFYLAKGEYIWIAESDDVAELDFLEKVMDDFKKDPNVVLGFSGIDFIDSKGDRLDIPGPVSLMKSQITKGDDFIRNNMLRNNNIINASAVVFRKDALKKVSTYYKSFKGSGDWLFWIDIIRQGMVCKVAGPLDHFRTHNNNVTTKQLANGEMMLEAHKIFCRLREYGYITSLNKYVVIGYWLRLISVTHKKFNNQAVEQAVISKWLSETSFNMFSRAMNLLYSLYYRFQTQILGHGIK